MVYTLIPIQMRQRQVNLCEFETSLVFIVSPTTARFIHRSTVSKAKNETQNPKPKQNKIPTTAKMHYSVISKITKKLIS